ncbi:MAG: hypothetical protein ACYSW3_24570 [Planctomycetota bacterium]|jgi:hypothetical protein
MKIECTQKQYCIAISRENFIKIMEKDFELQNEDLWDDTLNSILDNVKGVSDCDYNGHFGAYIFISVDPEFENNKFWESIKKIINDYVTDKIFFTD